MEKTRRIVFPLDVPDLFAARSLLGHLSHHVDVAKVGLELFTSEGPDAVRLCKTFGLPVFLDLKLHDIPETVERAVRSAGRHGVEYLTVHAAGGEKMLERAQRAAESEGVRILAVTVLTSLGEEDLRPIGFRDDPVAVHVSRLTNLARSAGITGFVASPAEASLIRRAVPEALIVTPGIRMPENDAGDQKRIATPFSAVSAGADLLVCGRPIRDAADPAAAASAIRADAERGAASRAQ